MTCEEAIAYIESYTWSEMRLGLERTRELLAALGNPQKGMKIIHVAGSNGKGSTCVMLASVLRAAGYRTGLYTSPHIERFHERLQVNGRQITDEELAEVTRRVKAAADAMPDHPSQFELSTAIAMEFFRKTNCELVVLEVGLGGALDSTNVIGTPEAAVITGISLEHTEYLGNTLAEIAQAKAGIIKPGGDVVCYNAPKEVMDVFEQTCRDKGARLHRTDPSRLTPLEHDLISQRFLWDGKEYTLPLLGRHQLQNASAVLTTLELLRSRGWKVPDDAVAGGLQSVRWPARLEVLRRDPLFILDGGHNPQCAQTLKYFIEDYLPGQKLTFLMGVLADKDWQAMLEEVRPFAGNFLCVTPDSPRALPAVELADYINQHLNVKAKAFDSVHDALDDALETSLSLCQTTIAFGSLYMAGDIRRFFSSHFHDI